MANELSQSERVKATFEHTLNEHGYGFQYAILEAAQNLAIEQVSTWGLEATEFPVEVQGDGTRIDIVLRRFGCMENGIKMSDRDIFFLLAECKRANPSFSNWCFSRAPITHRNTTSTEFCILERVEKHDWKFVSSASKRYQTLEHAYHIAVEVRADGKGDTMTGKSGKGAIEEAATQISRGLNGMVNFLSNNTQVFGENKSAVLLPVIFTTANLWATDVDLSKTNIETGVVDFTNHQFVQRSWLAYQYHLSPNIKHPHSPSIGKNSLSAVLEAEFVRTIYIVNAGGIEDFLRELSGFDLNP